MKTYACEAKWQVGYDPTLFTISVSRHFTITYCVKRNLPKKIVKLQLDRTYLLSCKNSVAILFKYIVVITDFQQFYRYCQHGKNVKKSFQFDVFQF